MKLIAETAWHHEGDFNFMRMLLDNILNKTKADVVKFHLLMGLDEYMDKNYALYQKLEKWMFTEYQWSELLDSALQSNMQLMLLFNDTKSIDFGMKYNPSLIEIHSTCLNDIYLLEKLKDKINKEQKVVLGVGGSSIYEIEDAIETLRHNNIILMFGFQNYPTSFSDINLKKMKRIMRLFPEFEYGYADHSAWNEKDNILITLLVAAIGMKYIEKHITIEVGNQRCDWQAAISIETFNEIEEKLNLLESIDGDGLIRLNEGEKRYTIIGPMKKAAFLSRNVKKGEKLNKELLLFKRTEVITDISITEILNKIGEEFSEDLSANTILNKNHFKRQ